MPVAIDTGLFHRLGIAVRGEADGPARWLGETLGAELGPSMPEPGDTHWTTMLQLGPSTVALFSAGEDDESGTIARYIDRFGAGLHSLAWRVDDLEAAETLVRERGVTITGINREARHWFLHPKESFGILVELTDQGVGSPRRTAPGAGPAREISWMTAVVEDLDAAGTFFRELFGAEEVSGLPSGSGADERTEDLQIGDVVLRFAQPISASSRYAGSRGLYSMALRVDDLDDVPLPIIEQNGDGAWTAPEDSLGLRLEWTTSGTTTS